MDALNPIDPEFAALPLPGLADAALAEAARLGAQHADFRAERIRGQRLQLADARLQAQSDSDDSGLAVRVIVDGTWGFASVVDLTPEAARRAARQAVEVAQVAAAMNTERIELAPEPGYGDVTWVSAYEVDPFSVPAKDKVDLLASWSADLLAHDVVSHVDAGLYQVKECKFYTDGATTATQQRVRLFPQLTAIAVTEGGFDDMRTVAPPVGQGWEYLTGPASRGEAAARKAWDFPGELARLPELLAEKIKAPSVQAGRYDLVIDPTNLWLTIH
jgi:TldD protein